jgi:molecular chaperone DnaK
LKEAAERETGMSVEKVVITVPAYFNDAQRSDTIRAGELAGLEVVRIINEPTSAALAYGCREGRREKILVYDLGGGTFDISLIDVEDGVVEVIATDGDTGLGGDDFDDLLSRFLIDHLPGKAYSEKDMKLRARLKNIAESTKIALSTHTTADIKESFISTVKGVPVNLEMLVTREDFEEKIADTVDRTIELTRGVVSEKKLKNTDISRVLLVGGSTYIPMVFDKLSSEFGNRVHRDLDPTYCVAVGAAIQGAIISGEEIDTILVDVISHSLGIRCAHMKITGEMDYDAYSVIIHRNTPIPTSMTKTYYTMVRNQEKIIVEAYQGEKGHASENTLIGSFFLDKLPKKLPVGSEIDVTFRYNIDGLVEITASERKAGGKERISVDVNRISTFDKNADPATRESGKKVQQHVDTNKIRRLLRMAKKRTSQLDDPMLQTELRTVIEELERALSEENGSAAELSEKLAEKLAGM